VVGVLSVCALSLVGCGTSASSSRSTTNNDAAVVRVYADALVVSAKTQQNVHFVDSRHVGRDVWIVMFRNKKGHNHCLAFELDRVSLSAIAENKVSGMAKVDCSEMSAHG
jgi:hypothetical protein